MLHELHLKNVGPASQFDLQLAPRLNLVTGDNGLGKSFLLDCMWWSLTRRWPRELNPALTSGYPAKPRNPGNEATISFALESKVKRRVEYTSKYVARDQAWTGKSGRPPNPGLVIYAHVDGGFSVWDPARNYWRTRGGVDVQDRPPGYAFTSKDIWDGLRLQNGPLVCRGLIADVASWVDKGADEAELMSEVLGSLAPRGDKLQFGPNVRLSLDDARDIPSIKTAYDTGVPIVHASAGVKRIVALAYVLLWSWHEHLIASADLHEDPTRQVVLLVDEIECHLHPRWQRSILHSLLSLVGTLHDEASIQLVALTHSPLILASAEPDFDDERDAWFDLDLVDGQVAISRRDFIRRGDVSAWLTSEAFDLKQARSLEAEQAMTRALELLRAPHPAAKALQDADRALARTLPDTDRFWIRWAAFRKGESEALKRGEAKAAPSRPLTGKKSLT